MKLLNNIAFLFAPTWRSRAYAQVLEQAGLIPSLAIQLPGEEPKWEGNDLFKISFDKHTEPLIFRPGNPVLSTIEKTNVILKKSTVPDINSEIFIDFVKGISQDVIIYAGFGGTILKGPVLRCGKKFLHIHGGYVPDYKGSTASYYSIIQEDTIGASAIWMDEKLDAGPVLLKEKVHPPQGIEIDRIIDPLYRAYILSKVLKKYADSGVWPDSEQEPENGEIFFVIHPVLKHLAMRKMKIIR